MTSKVEICRHSLSLIGDDFDLIAVSDDTKQGKACNLLFDKCRDQVLRAFPWAFAIKRYSLVPTTQKPTFGEGNMFAYPTDCLRIVKVEGKIPFSVEGKFIIANTNKLQLFGINKETDITAYDSEFCMCLAYLLASELCVTLSQDTKLKEQLLVIYRDLLDHAKTTSSFENSGDRYEVHGFLDSRLIGAF